MAGAGAIRAGRAFVEVFADDSPLAKGLQRAQGRLRKFGDSIAATGARVAGLGALASAPIAAAVRTFSNYEDAMASLRSAANPTAGELQQIEEAVGRIGKATGSGPAEVARAMTELLKAGLPVRQVLDGAAESALQFAKVAEMDAAEAAVVLTNAMNVFGVDAVSAVNALSRAADASSVSVQDVAMSFSMASAVAKQAGLSIDETANAIAILGQNGLRGSDAGTSLKTMLLRLQTGAGEAGEVMQALGINVRNADGSMRDMRGILASVQQGLAGLGAEARDQAMLKLFGTDAIRAGTILLDEGVAGWDRFSAKMAEGLPVAAKYAMLMDTLSGFFRRTLAAAERLGVAVGQALAPAFRSVGMSLAGMLDGLAMLAQRNPGLVQGVAAVVVGVTGLGVAMMGVGGAARLLAPLLGFIGSALGVMLSPIGLVVAGIALLATAFVTFTAAGRALFGELSGVVTQTIGGIADALAAGDIQKAAAVLWAGLRVIWLEGLAAIEGPLHAIGDWIIDAFAQAEQVVQQILNSIIGGVEKFVAIARAALGGLMKSLAEVAKNPVFAIQNPAAAAAMAGYNVGAAVQGAAPELERIDATTAGAGGVITDRAGEAARQREAARAAELAAAQNNLAAARAELSGLAGGPATSGADASPRMLGMSGLALPGEATGGAASPGMGRRGAMMGPLRMLGMMMAGGAMQAVGRTEVAGGFNAAGLAQMGVGGGIDGEILSEDRKQTKLLESLDQRARRGQIVFGA